MKNWKRYSLCVMAVAAITLVGFLGLSRRSTPPPPEKTLAKDQALSKWHLWSGETQLRGVNLWQKRIDGKTDGDSFGSEPLGPPYSEALLKKATQWGANYFHLSIPGPRSELPPFAEIPGYWKYVDTLLERIGKADAFAVVAFRTGPGREEQEFSGKPGSLKRFSVWREPSTQAQWLAMWQSVATHLRHHPVVVGYELMVEPNANVLLGEFPTAEKFDEKFRTTLADWNGLAQKLVQTIREVDKQTPILLAPANYSDPQWLSVMKKPLAENIVWSIHRYGPYEYTHQTPATPVPLPPGDLREQETTALKQYQKAFSPLAVTEYGVMRWAPNAETYLAQMTQAFESNGMNHAIWLWESDYPKITYHEFNFRFGTDPIGTRETPGNSLELFLRQLWSKNRARPTISPF